MTPGLQFELPLSVDEGLLLLFAAEISRSGNVFNRQLFSKPVSCKIFGHFGFRIQQLGSTLFKEDPATRINPFRSPFWCQNEGCHFGTKMGKTIWFRLTHLNSGSGFPDPDQLTCCTIYRCLFVELQLLRNQISLCQHVFYYTGFCSKTNMLTPWPNVINLFTAVIYCHSMVIPSFCVIKQHNLGNYCRMVVNYHINIYNIEFTLE